MPDLPTPSVPVSWGELLDKITILEIKRDRIAGVAAHANVEREYRLLRRIAEPALRIGHVRSLLTELKRVNARLWDVEDAIRWLDAEHRFDAEFVAHARSVYRRNDERAALKRQLNLLLSSELIEEKSYPAFDAQADAATAELTPAAAV